MRNRIRERPPDIRQMPREFGQFDAEFIGISFGDGCSVERSSANVLVSKPASTIASAQKKKKRLRMFAA